MSKSRTVESLEVKRAQIAEAIAAFDTKLTQARKDLAHITVAIAIFESAGDRKAAQEKRGQIRRVGMRADVCVWAAPK